jgi:hypothetical protein
VGVDAKFLRDMGVASIIAGIVLLALAQAMRRF